MRYLKEDKKKILIVDTVESKHKYKDLIYEGLFEATFEVNPLYGFSLAISGRFDLVIVGYFLGVDKINGVSLINLIKLRTDVPCLIYSDMASSLSCMIGQRRNKPEGIIDRQKSIYPECLEYM